MATAMEVSYSFFHAVIFLGYIYLGLGVAPYLGVRFRVTKVAGVLFFVTCGLTHLHIINSHAESPSLPALINTVVQAGAVWVFAMGVNKEFGRGSKGSKGRGKDKSKSEG